MRCRSAWAVLFGVVVLAAGCTRADPDAAPTPPSLAPTSSTAVSAAPVPSAQQAVDAYQAMWRAFGHASETADWKSPELARYASGYALSQLVESLQANEVRGIATRGTFRTQPVVQSADPAESPTAVRVHDCGDDSDTTRVSMADGTPLGGGGGRHRIEAEIRLEEGMWKVTDFRLRAVGSC